MDSSDSDQVDWPPSPVRARLANFLDSTLESSSSSSSDDYSLPNSWGGMTPYEANILAIASKSISLDVSQSPHSKPLKVQHSQKVQQKDGSKSPYSKSDKAHRILSNKLKRKHVSISQPTTARESSSAKRSSAQKVPRNGPTTKQMKSPKRKSLDARKSQPSLSPYLRKVASSRVSVSPNTSNKVHVATSPSGGSGRNKMPFTSWNVNPLPDHKGPINGYTTAASSCVSLSRNNTPHEKHIATSSSGRSSMNVHPLKDHKVDLNRSYTTPMEEVAHNQEKFCDLRIPRRELFSGGQGTENRAPKGDFPFKKSKFRFDYLPDVDEFLDAMCDLPEGKTTLGSTDQKKVSQKGQFSTNKPSDLDSVLLNKSEPTVDEPVKQNGNLEKLTEDQYVILRSTFSDNPYPSVAEVNQLAADFGVSAPKIKAYFGSKRGTLRRKMRKQGIPIKTKEDMCLCALDDSKKPAWGELLFKSDEAEGEDDHIGNEASGGKFLSLLCDIGLDLVKSY